MQIPDDIYLGAFSLGAGNFPTKQSDDNPTAQIGVGPAGRVVFWNVVPLTLQVNNVALSQHMTNGTGLTLAAGTGTTLGTAPDGSGSPVILFDVPRCASLTCAGGTNLSGINFTFTGFDWYGRKTTQTLAGPNGNTVNTTKTFVSILSCVPNTTDGTHNVSAGTSDIFGLPWYIADAGLVIRYGWANQVADDAGTFTAGDTTSPATASTGDPRGTYLPSSSSNGSKRLVIGMHVVGNQCGSNAVLANAIGVTPA